MPTKPSGERTAAWTALRAIRLNWREILPIRSPRHPGNLSTPPSDAIAVLWLDSEGPRSDPRFAYLNHARAYHLYMELSRILNGESRSSIERAQAALGGQNREAQVSGG